MASEVVIYGWIEGASWRTTDEEYRRLQYKNAVVFYQLPVVDEYPWLVRNMFALPAPWPQGTYRQQVIHFGASIKDDPFDPGVWDRWLTKFESLLRRLYWYSATVHVECHSRPPRTVRWTPTPEALARMSANEPEPIRDWVRTDPPAAETAYADVEPLPGH